VFKGNWLDKLKATSKSRRTHVRLNLDLDYVVDEEDRKNPNFKTNQSVSITLLRTAMNAAKTGSKERTAVRTHAKVVNTLTKASNAKADFLDIDELQLKAIAECLKNWMTESGVPSSLAGWFEELLSAVEKLLETKPEAKS
jgi:hypothetical protein